MTAASCCKTENRRIITRRGVIWLGQTCNLHCHFCYFLDRIKSQEHPEHPFMSLEKAKKICRILADVYGNNAVDIQGGEPTIYPGIVDLVSYCREIGLLPTLITNALVLDNRERCKNLRNAGLRDFLVSVHGIGATFDAIVGVHGAHVRQMKALDNLQALDIPFRFNCVLSKPALPQLLDIARLADRSGCRVVNFIAFNPFEDQQKQGMRSVANVPRYIDVAAYLKDALDFLDDVGIECNVRYLPLCMVEERHRKSMYNFQQLSYDIHEWDFASWSWSGLRSQRMRDGGLSSPVSLEEANRQPLVIPEWLRSIAGKFREKLSRYPEFLRATVFMSRTIGGLVASRIEGECGELDPQEQLYRTNARIRARYHCNYRYSTACSCCSVKGICDGFHGDYASLFGVDEAIPVQSDTLVDDPKFYINSQLKIVEEEDHDWAS